ncbi:karyopherin [Knufia peltigerae]|uniref:Karyopherin n=1 Tax=Knufia peltigerae TaxID=1002370 RepID=A0AA38YER4_9EURO|nr:karyopherin [Knufia peltigerae]
MTDTSTVNGTSNGASQQAFDTANVLQALDLIHNPSTKNDIRRQASDYLESLKASSEAPQFGFTLSTDRSQSPLVRHFGLSLLGHVIRHEGHNLSEDQNVQLRNCVLGLGQDIQPADLAFIRNKVAELWIELAKRSWALDWFDLDEQLVKLWFQDLVHKDFVLTVLESLSEDAFVRDDSIAVLRGRELNSALVEIFTSSANYAGGIKIGDVVHHVRCGEDGWLIRIKQFLDECHNAGQITGGTKDTVVKALATLRSAFLWVMTSAISHSLALAATCSFLTQSDADLVLAAIDVLLSLYGRPKMEEIEVQALVHPLVQPESIMSFQPLYSWSVVSVDDIDSSRYTISKKLSELMSLLSDHMVQYPPPDAGSLNLEPFLRLIIAMAEHESLIVSIPVVHAWVRLLEVASWRNTPVVQLCLGPLLQVTSQRLIQYDQLPEDAQSPEVIFINEEIELFPERQGFYTNYRKLCSAVVEVICYSQLDEAVQAVLKRADELLDEVQAFEQQLDLDRYQRLSMNLLKADSYFSMVDAAFKGLDRWQNMHREYMTPKREEVCQRVREASKAWMLDTMSRRQFRDPMIRERLIKSAVEVSNKALQKDTGFAFNVLEHILSSFIVNDQQNQAYVESVNELNGYATVELRRLSQQHADYFVTFYDQLQSKFTDLINQLGADERLQIDLESALFSVIQRATSVDYADRQARLQEFLQPIAVAWVGGSVQESLQSFESFAHFQAFDRVGPYLDSLRAIHHEDWSSVPFDNHGQQIQLEMMAGYIKLPLRKTRMLLSISSEKLQEGSTLHKMACDLWSPMISNILPPVLRLTSYNHRLHDPASWPNVTPQLEPVVRRVLRDRYWQSGISSGSMNDFHSKVKSTKSTLEGFASSVRGRIRGNLEQCYGILHCLSRLGPAFYSLQQVPEMIAEAVVDTAAPLGPHHFSVLIQMLTKMVEECPAEYRQQFLTPILASLLRQMDTKLSTDWANMMERKQIKVEEENLDEEMRDESILRVTTSKAVNLVGHWLNPKREQELSSKKAIVNGNYPTQGNRQPMRDFLLSNVNILDRLLVFMSHGIAFRDTKSCSMTLETLRRIVPEFAFDRFIAGQEAVAVREFISTDVLKTAITCLNDGYFADQQGLYAHLIATIWVSYGLSIHVPATTTEGGQGQPAHERPPLTQTPRDVILSLPGMTERQVKQAAAKLAREGLSGRPKKLRAIMMSLLEGVRGVRISELGKIDMRPQHSKILEKYKQRELLDMHGVEGGTTKPVEDDGVDLGGIADMFAS